MRVTLRVEDQTTHKLGADIAVDGTDYDSALATARAQLPSGYLVNAVLVDRPLPAASSGR